jgi:hypothetical protein
VTLNPKKKKMNGRQSNERQEQTAAEQFRGAANQTSTNLVTCARAPLAVVLYTHEHHEGHERGLSVLYRRSTLEDEGDDMALVVMRHKITQKMVIMLELTKIGKRPADIANIVIPDDDCAINIRFYRDQYSIQVRQIPKDPEQVRFS